MLFRSSLIRLYFNLMVLNIYRNCGNLNECANIEKLEKTVPPTCNNVKFLNNLVTWTPKCDNLATSLHAWINFYYCFFYFNQKLRTYLLQKVLKRDIGNKFFFWQTLCATIEIKNVFMENETNILNR
jgi:hypothetical protein